MRKVFIDTSFLIAINFPDDQWHQKAVWALHQLGDDVQLWTTEVVLHEFLTCMSRAGRKIRDRAFLIMLDILAKGEIKIIWHEQKWFAAGLALYGQRRDKEYSLQDCILMAIMYDMGIVEILSSDHHFEQERFIILMK